MPRSKEQFEEMRNSTREKIHSAAIYLFARKGLAGTSVQDIAEKAGISIGLLYRHFKTKESLYYSLVEFVISALQEITIRLKSDGSPKAIVQSILDEIYPDLQNSEDFTDIMALFIQAVLRVEEEQKIEKFLEQDIIMIQAMADLIAKGQKLGEFRAGDPYEMSIYFFSLIQGIAVSAIAFGEAFKLPEKSLFTAYLYNKKGVRHGEK
jgi:AcrR family transcriptional regulator